MLYHEFVESLENEFAQVAGDSLILFKPFVSLRKFVRVSGDNYGQYAGVLKEAGILNPPDDEEWFEIDKSDAFKLLERVLSNTGILE